MEHKLCLNCNHVANDKFCSNCGQKTDTHRIVLKHFLLHDMLHGVWHLEKGILFTVKEIFVRPGQAALDYIKGKRIRYYNVFYLSLLLIGLNVLLSHFFDSIHPQISEESKETQTIGVVLEKYLKVILLGIVPVIALNAMLIFRRLRLNFAEHLIVAGFNLAGMLLLNLLILLFNFINTYEPPALFGYLEVASFIVCILFPIWAYHNATKGCYTKLGFVWRVTVFYLLTIIAILGIVSYIILVLTGRTDIYLNM